MTEKQNVSEKTMESWCVEEQTMDVDFSLLRQVEDLERKVVTAGLHVKVQTINYFYNPYRHEISVSLNTFIISLEELFL